MIKTYDINEPTSHNPFKTKKSIPRSLKNKVRGKNEALCPKHRPKRPIDDQSHKKRRILSVGELNTTANKTNIKEHKILGVKYIGLQVSG